MDFKRHLEQAWTLTLREIKSLLLMTVVLGVVCVFSAGILGPWVMAGYMQSILRLIRSGREPKIQDLFSEVGLLLPLIGFGLAAVIVVYIGLSMVLVPGVLLSVGITFCCLYMLPLMTDRNFGLVDALKESVAIVTGEHLMDHVIVAILYMGISAIGGSVFIGWVFTQPLATLFLISVYEDHVAGSASRTPPGPPPTDHDDFELRQK